MVLEYYFKSGAYQRGFDNLEPIEPIEKNHYTIPSTSVHASLSQVQQVETTEPLSKAKATSVLEVVFDSIFAGAKTNFKYKV